MPMLCQALLWVPLPLGSSHGGQKLRGNKNTVISHRGEEWEKGQGKREVCFDGETLWSKTVQVCGQQRNGPQ